MIKYSGNTINDWNFNEANINKVYYGVTTTSRLPDGYTEVEYVENNTKGAYINTNLLLYDVTGNSFSISAKLSSTYYSATGDADLETLINSEDISSPYNGFTYRYAHSTHILEGTNNPQGSVSFSSIANADGTSALTISCNSTTVTTQVPLGLFASYVGNFNTPYRWAYMKLYSMQITKNNALVRDFVPCIRDNDNMVGLYDLVNNVFYYPPNYSSYQLVAGNTITLSAVGNVVYQKITTGDTPTPPTPKFEGKWVGYYPDSSVGYSADCDGSTAITKSQVRQTDYTNFSKIIIGDCVTGVSEAFQRCSALTEVEIGSGVTVGSFYAFEWCTSLTSATWYATDFSSGSIDGVFQGCENLQRLIMYAPTPPDCTITVFRWANPSITVYVPDESISAYQNANYWSDFTIKGLSEL